MRAAQLAQRAAPCDRPRVPQCTAVYRCVSQGTQARVAALCAATWKRPQPCVSRHGCAASWRGGVVRAAEKEQQVPSALEFPGDGGLQVGAVLNGKYTITAKLGEGANATTFEARTSDGSLVALKRLSLRGLRDWKSLELFQREASVLQALRHPGVPRYLDYFEYDTNSNREFFIVQEEVQGQSLGDMIRSGMRADDAEILRIAREMLDILGYLQSVRPPVVHRDIKPDNIIVERGEWGGRVHLVDFGGVQGIAEDEDRLGSTVVGTYGYMAPEQFRGGALPASDLYGLGATLLYLASGRPPSAFPQQRMRVDLSSVQVGPTLGALLQGLLEPVAEDRYTVEEAQRVADGQPARARAPVREARGELLRDASAPRQQTASASDPWMVRTSQGVYQVPAPLPQARWARKPAGTRVTIERSPTNLQVDIPPAGLTGSTAFTGVFAVAWNAFVAFWTVSALASGGVVFALFSAPFWFAGYQLAGQAFGGALSREHLEVGRTRFSLTQELALLKGAAPQFGGGRRARNTQGLSDDLLGARVVTTLVVNGEPQTAVELLEGVNKYRFGEGLQTSEQEWIVAQINDHLAEMRGRAPSMEEMPPLEPPRVYTDESETLR